MTATLVALDDMADTREQLGTPGQEIWRTFFLKPEPGSRAPQAFLVEYAPGRVLATHYHDVDEFQIVVAGHGTFGRHTVQPYAVHFARAYTPYGPITAGPQGLSFLTLRAQRDSSGPQKLPEKRAALEQVAGRRPFQAAQVATLGAVGDCVAITPLERFGDGAGLGAWVVDVPAGVSVRLPRAPGASGAYAALLKGSMRVDARLLLAPAVAFVEAHDEPMRVTAGDAAAQWLVLSFPQPLDASVATSKRTLQTGGMPHAGVDAPVRAQACWDCKLCGFRYDEAAGLPELGIAPGTVFRDLPHDWRCHDCDAPRSEFERADRVSAAAATSG